MLPNLDEHKKIDSGQVQIIHLSPVNQKKPLMVDMEVQYEADMFIEYLFAFLKQLEDMIRSGQIDINLLLQESNG
jgi:hypothetical protein